MDNVLDHENIEDSKVNPKVVKVKKPFLKLDAQRLEDKDIGMLSIYNDIKYNLKIKGKGHEITDLQRLMNIYRGWHSKIMPSYKFNYFIKQLRKQGKDPRVKKSLDGLRKIHKGKITMNENNNGDQLVEDNDFAPSEKAEKNPDPEPNQYNEEDFNAYYEAEEAQKNKKLEEDLLLADELQEEIVKKPTKEEEEDDDISDLEDILNESD